MYCSSFLLVAAWPTLHLLGTTHSDMASHTRRLDLSNLQFMVQRLSALYVTATVHSIQSFVGCYVRFAFIHYVDCTNGQHWHLLSVVLAVIRLACVMLLQADTLLLENYVLPVDLRK